MFRNELNPVSPTYVPGGQNTESDKEKIRTDTSPSVIKDSKKVTFQPLERRNIKTPADAFREKLINIKQAIQSLDIPFDRSNLTKSYKQALSDLEASLKNVETPITGYPDSFNKFISILLPDICFPANLSVVQALANMGMGLEEPQYLYDSNIPASLLRQLLENTDPETAKKILQSDANDLICRADPAYMELLEDYLSPDEIQRTANKLMRPPENITSLLYAANTSYRFSDKAALSAALIAFFS
ncbi:hypothetical protein [Endozoicomonas lisbonensis]|uniref:Uncharacterized protein n=1 Tax=Endozoicomonas lisbonensis TaxID=3120522 RepID=A0ABV2SJP2_9GAMM